MIRAVSFDPSRRLDLHLRINRIGNVTFSFLQNDLPFSLIYEEFEFFIKRYAGDRQKVISLEIGTGLSVDDNDLVASVTADQSNISEGEYYWELLKLNSDQTWLSGKAWFHNGPFDNSFTTPSFTIVENGDIIQVTITPSASSASGQSNWRGAYDLAANTPNYPSSGGTGVSGVPGEGNTWYVSTSGDLDVTGLGVVTLNVGAILIYLGGTVSSPASWRVIQ